MAALASLGTLFSGGGLSAIGTGIGLIGSIAQGAAAKSAADQEAAEMERQAKEETASAQREAFEKRKEGALVMSRQQALAAAGGGGADDPTIVKLMTQTAGQSEYNAGTDMYGGLERAQGLKIGASNRRKEGSASLLGSVLGGFGKAFS